MDKKEFIKQSTTEGKNNNEVTGSKASQDSVLIEEKLNGEKLYEKNYDVVKMPESAFYFSIYLLALIGWLIFLRLSNSRKILKNRSTTLQYFSQIPCRTCRFFTNNQYLKCAVHPSTVLKQQAINCPDYWSQYR